MTGRRVLVVDEMVPHAVNGAGYPRFAAIVRLLDAEGFRVSFYALCAPAHEASAGTALPKSVDVLPAEGLEGFVALLERRRADFDFILVSRPTNMSAIVKRLDWKRAAFGDARLVYDAEALFSTREIMKRKLLGTGPSDEATTANLLERELRLASVADHITAVSQREAAYLARSGKPVSIVGHAIAPQPTPRAWKDRRGILFVGRLDVELSPNVDSLEWLVGEVLPLLAREEPELRLTVVGKNAAVTALAGERVELLGAIDDLTPLYDAARVFVAPTRFAAGIPHKVHEAAARGVPAVVTPLVATQLAWRDGEAVRVAEDAPAFAAAVLALHRDEDEWTRIREGALRRVAEDCTADAFRSGLLAAFDEGARRP